MVGYPMFASWELSRRIAATRTGSEASEAQAIADLRRALVCLPETRHPLGL